MASSSSSAAAPLLLLDAGPLPDDCTNTSSSSSLTNNNNNISTESEDASSSSSVASSLIHSKHHAAILARHERSLALVDGIVTYAIGASISLSAASPASSDSSEGVLVTPAPPCVKTTRRLASTAGGLAFRARQEAGGSMRLSAAHRHAILAAAPAWVAAPMEGDHVHPDALDAAAAAVKANKPYTDQMAFPIGAWSAEAARAVFAALRDASTKHNRQVWFFVECETGNVAAVEAVVNATLADPSHVAGIVAVAADANTAAAALDASATARLADHNVRLGIVVDAADDGAAAADALDAIAASRGDVTVAGVRGDDQPALVALERLAHHRRVREAGGGTPEEANDVTAS